MSASPLPRGTSPLPTTLRPTTVPGCLYKGRFYPPGEIEQGSDHSDGNWCYGTVCDSSGYVWHWDNFDCGPSTPLPTTNPTPPPGCFYNGKFYPPGDIDSGDNGHGWCYGTYCTDDYQVISWDNFNCGTTSTTPLPTTTPPYPTSFPPTFE